MNAAIKPRLRSSTSRRKNTPTIRQKSKTPATEPIRIQKYLAAQGIASRRGAEAMIAAKRVKINETIAQLGMKILPGQRIRIDGKLLKVRAPVSRVEVLLYHKRSGEVCTKEQVDAHPNVFARLPAPRQGRWIMVGRLDINTSGLLLFTNHGALAHRLMHPRYQLDREYAARVAGKVDEAMITRLLKGVILDDGEARFLDLQPHPGNAPQSFNRWFYVVVQSGRNRLVRRLWESQQVRVSRLIRVRFAHIVLEKYLRHQRYDLLDAAAVKALAAQVELNL